MPVPTGGPIAPLRTWQEPPQVEGRVLYVDGPHKQKKGDLYMRFPLLVTDELLENNANMFRIFSVHRSCCVNSNILDLLDKTFLGNH